MSKDEITPERIERALRLVAWIIATHGETEYVPLMERLEQELKIYRAARDPISRARTILREYDEAHGGKA